MITTIRAMWKDWGFAPTLLDQAKQLVDQARRGTLAETCTRASILFSVMAVEAYFKDAVRGFIEANRAHILSANLKKVEDGLIGRGRRVAGIYEALGDWPQLLTGKPLDKTIQAYKDYDNFRNYRNLLVHGRVSDTLPSGKLAQEVETLKDAEHAILSAAEMIKAMAAHFGLQPPTWA